MKVVLAFLGAVGVVLAQRGMGDQGGDIMQGGSGGFRKLPRPVGDKVNEDHGCDESLEETWCHRLGVCLALEGSAFETAAELQSGCNLPRSCCKAQTAVCLACRQGVSVEEYCETNIYNVKDCLNKLPGSGFGSDANFGNSPDRLPGGHTDEHGCLKAGGYSWCTALGRCSRPMQEVQFDTDGDAVVSNQEYSAGCGNDVQGSAEAVSYSSREATKGDIFGQTANGFNLVLLFPIIAGIVCGSACLFVAVKSLCKPRQVAKEGNTGGEEQFSGVAVEGLQSSGAGLLQEEGAEKQPAVGPAEFEKLLEQEKPDGPAEGGAAVDTTSTDALA